MILRIKKLSADVILPAFAHETDAGLDLFSIEKVTLAPKERVQVKTGLALAIPDGYVGLIWDKSGVSHIGGIKVMGGVIDSGYRGEVLVGLINLGSESYTFKKGAKIAQMLIQRVEHPDLEEVSELDDTVRGEGGIGSTGK